MTWHCYGDGMPGSSCDVTGETQVSAERHTDTGHVTVTHEATWARERNAA